MLSHDRFRYICSLTLEISSKIQRSNKIIDLSIQPEISDCLKMFLRFLFIGYMMASAFRQLYMLPWCKECLLNGLAIDIKIKRPADLSIVKRLGRFYWCKGNNLSGYSRKFHLEFMAN